MAANLVKTALKIPYRIERGPTDILKALSKTVKYDAANTTPFAYDEPFLQPNKSHFYKAQTLSKLSGIRMANYIKSKHPELFHRDDSEPKVEEFQPKEEFRTDMDLTEEDFKWALEHKDVENAIIAYQVLKDKNLVSDELTMQFFEMSCSTNDQRLLEFDEHESQLMSKDIIQTWSTKNIASKMFDEIKDSLDSSRIYSAIIAGMYKFSYASEALQIFEQFETNHPDKGLYPEAYDVLIRIVKKTHSSTDDAHKAVDKLTKHMERNLVKPDLLVMNSILSVYSAFDCSREVCDKAYQIFNDMIALDIKPSLGTYKNLIMIILKYGRRDERVNVPKLFTQIESDESLFEIRDVEDVDFYVTLMSRITNYQSNLAIANRLHKLYLKHPIQVQRYKTLRYMTGYFNLFMAAESMENIEKFYRAYVPKFFQPSVASYDILTEVIELYKPSIEFIRRVGFDVIDNGLSSKLKRFDLYKQDPAIEKHLMEYIEEYNNKMERYARKSGQSLKKQPDFQG